MPDSCFLRLLSPLLLLSFFFFNDTATTEIYTLSLHDALPISRSSRRPPCGATSPCCWSATGRSGPLSSAEPPSWEFARCSPRSEEHTSELQSRLHLVCRLLLEKKKTRATTGDDHTACADF